MTDPGTEGMFTAKEHTGMDICWKLKAIGSSAGRVNMAAGSISVRSGVPECETPGGRLPEAMEIIGEKGKLADSEDSFLFVYCEIDPHTQNLELSASFEVGEMESVPNQQTGFGIMAVDTVFSGDAGTDGVLCRHRNHLLLGRFRTVDGKNHSYGLRAVGGYTDPRAAEYEPVRLLDPSRLFSMQEPLDRIRPGDRCDLTLRKTDEGFTAVMQKDGVQETILFPGCDFLLRQDNRKIAIGFAAAGKVHLSITGIHAEFTGGKISQTPEGAIRGYFPDYPFPGNLFNNENELARWTGERKNEVLYASPKGTPDQAGTRSEPVDLDTAVRMAGEGSMILLLDGIYHMEEPLYLPAGSGGSFQDRREIRAEHTGRAVLDGTGLRKRSPFVVLRGNYWILEGLVFRNSPLSGILICGSGNQLRRCTAFHNGDTGMLICSYPGEERVARPSYNRIEDCDSYDNCDPFYFNADGFGAKMSIGSGNEFYRCVAHHNIDDGFDLYTKSILGPTAPVLLEQCVACNNGRTLGDQHIRKDHSGGTGFKLGGEHQAVNHILWDCAAYLNCQYGFSSNTNPTLELHYCSSLRNGRRHSRDNYNFTCLEQRQKHSWVLEGLYPPVTADGKEKKWSVSSVAGRLRRGKTEIPRRRDDGAIVFSGRSRKRMQGCHSGADRKKNILMIISSLGGGGAERVTTILAGEFAKKHNVYLLYLNARNQCYQIGPGVHAIDASISGETLLHKLFHVSWRFPYFLWAILRAKQKYRIDSTISMLYKPNLYNGFIRWKDRRVMSERNDPSRKPAREFEDAKKSYRRADHIVFQSEKVKALFSKQVQAKSSIIRNPIRVTCFADPVPAKKIVTAGRYTEQKNHALLIRAFALFYQEHPSYTLHLYGSGKLYEDMKELIGELGLEHAVFLEDFQDDIHEAIRDARMFVLSSDYEGMSNALMEAMMMGIPCISTACTGSEELLTDEETGLLVPVGDEKALAAAMGRLAEDEELCGRLRTSAQLLSLTFETDKVVRAWERILFR